MRLGRHPRGVDLGAWFDGEGRSSVGSHVARCGACRRRVDELARVRAWVRAQPMYRMSELGVPGPSSNRRPSVAAGAATLAVVVALILAGVGRPSEDATAGSGRDSTSSSLPGAGLTLAPAVPDGAPVPVSGSFPVDHAPERTVAVGATTAPDRPGASLIPGRAGPLRLGLVVPTVGPDAADGANVVDVVQRAVAVANGAGGVGGYPVELTVIPAEDDAGLAAAARTVDVFVGGFGVEPQAGVPWLLPADPSVTGADVLMAEASPAAAGAHLGASLLARGLTGPVGVLVGGGPDAGLATGLAAKSELLRVPVRSSTCFTEMAALEREKVAAVAIAGSPDLVRRCTAAAAKSLFRPRLGISVPASAAYAGLHDDLFSWGVRTVLAFPWPSGSAPGAARFRATGARPSYRSLVSLAATELAIAVARQRGSVSVADVAAGSWPSDLLDLVGTTSRGATVAAAGPQGWTPESS